jgi:hypothetical protein
MTTGTRLLSQLFYCIHCGYSSLTDADKKIQKVALLQVCMENFPRISSSRVSRQHRVWH